MTTKRELRAQRRDAELEREAAEAAHDEVFRIKENLRTQNAELADSLRHSRVVRDRLSAMVARFSEENQQLKVTISGHDLIEHHQVKTITNMGRDTMARDSELVRQGVVRERLADHVREHHIEIEGMKAALRKGWNWQQYEYARDHPDQLEEDHEPVLGIDTPEREAWLLKQQGCCCDEHVVGDQTCGMCPVHHPEAIPQ